MRIAAYVTAAMIALTVLVLWWYSFSKSDPRSWFVLVAAFAGSCTFFLLNQARSSPYQESVQKLLSIADIDRLASKAMSLKQETALLEKGKQTAIERIQFDSQIALLMWKREMLLKWGAVVANELRSTDTDLELAGQRFSKTDEELVLRLMELTSVPRGSKLSRTANLISILGAIVGIVGSLLGGFLFSNSNYLVMAVIGIAAGFILYFEDVFLSKKSKPRLR